MHADHAQLDESSRSTGFWSGIVIAVGTALLVAFMAMHPTLHHHDPERLVAEMKQIAPFNAFVHGTLMGVMALIWIGFWGFAQRLGFASMLVRAGLGGYTIGALALIATASINGFIFPSLIVDHADDGPNAFDAMRSVMALCLEVEQTTVRVGVVACLLGVGAWSIALWRSGSRALGAVGVLLAAAPLVAVLSGNLPMHVHGFGAFVLAQAIWYAGVAIQLMRGRI